MCFLCVHMRVCVGFVYVYVRVRVRVVYFLGLASPRYGGGGFLLPRMIKCFENFYTEEMASEVRGNGSALGL